jgi:hypothetical protein
LRLEKSGSQQALMPTSSSSSSYKRIEWAAIAQSI